MNGNALVYVWLVDYKKTTGNKYKEVVVVFPVVKTGDNENLNVKDSFALPELFMEGVGQ